MHLSILSTTTCLQLSLRFARSSVGPKIGESAGHNGTESVGSDTGSVSAASGSGSGASDSASGSGSGASDGGSGSGASDGVCVSSYCAGDDGHDDRGDGEKDSDACSGIDGSSIGDSAGSSGAVSQWSCDLLVGADGIFSKVRQQLVGTQGVHILRWCWETMGN